VPTAIIDKLKELKVDPAQIAMAVEKLKQVFPAAKGMSIDPVVAATVLTTGVNAINKLNVGQGIKSLLVKLAIFAFGIFCGIGIVYKSGLPLPSENPSVTPPANVSVYQKRIEQLQEENTQLRKLLRLQQQPSQPDPNGPQIWPLPNIDQPKAPVLKTDPTTPRPGFIVK
jgi:hypothetical protein